MYVRKEALLSSQIEGTQSSLSDLMLFEHNQKPTVSSDDVEEVSNYVKAIHYGLDRLKNDDFPLSLRLLREIHGILLSGSRGSTKLPGEFRRSQNWIGGTRPGNALFVPPPIEYLDQSLADFENFLHDDTLPLLIKTAIAHVQFESIHPFLDGNGRLGRLLIVLLLCNSGMLDEPVLYLSLYFKQNKQQYYDLLQEVRDNGTWETWVEFFLEGIISTSAQTLDTVKKINKLFESDLAKIESLGRARFTCTQALEYLKQLPQVSVQLLSQELKVSLPTARSSLNNMTSLGILKETSGKQRDKIYVYQKYLNILEDAPLVEAAKNGETESVRRLLESADVNDNDIRDGKTALHWAAQFAGCTGYPFEILKLLLKHSDIDVNIRDNDKHTALYYAAESGWFKAIEILAPRTDCYGRTEALAIAQEYYSATSNHEDRKQIVKLIDDILIKHGDYMPQKEIIPSSKTHYADTLTEAEWSLSKSAMDNLDKVSWSQELLTKAKELREEYEKSPKTFQKHKLLQLKQTMFEIRFAAAINRTNCIAQNEYKAGIGKTDVDFKVTDINQQEWLIELTNPRTSDAVKENTKILKNGIQEYSSTTSDNINSSEVRDIIKTQKAIFSKVANDNNQPIKFPLTMESKAYHIIVISMNSFNGYSSDEDDYINIADGSKTLTNILNVRYFKKEMIKGVFGSNHNNPKAKILQARVHAVVFIKENFEEGDTNIDLYVNHDFKDKKNTIENAFAKIVKYPPYSSWDFDQE